MGQFFAVDHSPYNGQQFGTDRHIDDHITQAEWPVPVCFAVVNGQVDDGMEAVSFSQSG